MLAEDTERVRVPGKADWKPRSLLLKEGSLSAPGLTLHFVHTDKVPSQNRENSSKLI